MVEHDGPRRRYIGLDDLGRDHLGFRVVRFQDKLAQLEHAKTSSQTHTVALALTGKRLGNQSRFAAIHDGKIAPDPASGPFVPPCVTLARLQLGERAQHFALEDVRVFIAVVQHVHPFAVGVNPSQTVMPELDAGAIRIFSRGIELETLNEDVALAAVDGGDPTGVAVQSDLADLVIVTDFHQAALGVGLKGRVVLLAENDFVAPFEVALRIDRAPGPHQPVEVVALGQPSVQLRVSPDSPATRLVVDVGHGGLDRDTRGTRMETNAAAEADTAAGIVAAGQPDRHAVVVRLGAVGLTVQHSVRRPRPLSVVVPALRCRPKLVAAVVHPTAVRIEARVWRRFAG